MNLQQKIQVYFRWNVRAKKECLQQLSLYEQILKTPVYPQNTYKKGDMVQLTTKHYLHGLRGAFCENNLRQVREKGLLARDFFAQKPQRRTSSYKVKTPKQLNLWRIQQPCTLAAYINLYSGAVLMLQSEGNKKDIRLVAKNEMPTILDWIHTQTYWFWQMEQTKEQRFLPVQGQEFVQVAFILRSVDTRLDAMLEKDIFSKAYSKQNICATTPKWFCENILFQEHTPLTTNRESAILLGLPPSAIEGVFVSEAVENNEEQLQTIQAIFPWCYICNLQGKIIK